MAKILVVDDQQFILRIVSRQLEFAEHEVATAPDGESGLAALAESKPDLIFCDIGMPNIDGYEMLEKIRATPEWADIPVVMLTAHGQVSDWERAKALGANGYLTKPFSAAQLLEVVNQWLQPSKS